MKTLFLELVELVVPLFPRAREELLEVLLDLSAALCRRLDLDRDDLWILVLQGYAEELPVEGGS